jgi:hypothetical protein
MLRILSAFLISFAASFFAGPFARALDGSSGPGEERTQPSSPTGSLATDLVKACQLADPDDLPAFELCRPQVQQEPEQPQMQQKPAEPQMQQQAQQKPAEPQMQPQARQQQNSADEETVGQGIWPTDE